MAEKNITLSDVIDFFKKNQTVSFEDEIDKYGNYFITAGRLAAVVLSANPLVALSNFCAGIDTMSLRVSKLFTWLPDRLKYGEGGRENFAIARYKLSSIIYVKILNIAILDSFKDILLPLIKKVLESELNWTEHERNELKKIAKEAEISQKNVPIDTFSTLSLEKLNEIINKITDPIFPVLIEAYYKSNSEKEKIDLNDFKKRYVQRSYTLFNAFLINLSSEFPEFVLWFDLKQKNEILEEISFLKQNNSNLESNLAESFAVFEEKTNRILEKLEVFKKDEFLAGAGFPSFDSIYKDLFKVQAEDILDRIEEKTRDNIKAHHNLIRKEIEKSLSDNNDILEIIYPKNKDIYIAQAYQSVVYFKKEHRRLFLTTSDFDKISEKGENVAQFLLELLVNPKSTTRPIIILGNPGAGKSMFSKMFSAKLCETTDYIPFLVRLRDVASSTSNISEHINKGIAGTIGLTQDINWIEWAKLFKSRIPVILLDGFDELMQSSNIELNGYINSIRDLQETALNHGICLKIILTSRIAVMQDVSIPDSTFIVKLNAFDLRRRLLWIEKWNSFQKKKKYVFKLPNDKKVLELSQEPLLLFMLAVYDFPASDLQNIALEDSFNQSKLYDSLLSQFSIRQLEKEDNYINGNTAHKIKEEEMFRLRLGLISLLMFLTDTTNKDISRLDEELRVCKLDDSKIKPIDVLTGFFFVHQNKSTSEDEIENYNYEFLHKSFGEFLAADFLLRIAKKQKNRQSKDIELFRFCFGYNWLHKHPEIQKFLFEHVSNIFNLKENEQDRIIDEIYDSLSGLFDKTINDLPISRFTIIPPRSRIEHLAIFSQNLIFLWLALNNCDKKIRFEIYSTSNEIYYSNSEPDEIFSYVSQDRDEISKSKSLWKRITSLWQLVGNYHSVAKLYEWIDVVEEEDCISLIRRKEKIEIKNNFHESSIVSCNDFNFIISLFDTENKCNYKDFFENLKVIIKQKPELKSLSDDAIIFRLEDVRIREPKMIEVFLRYLLASELTPRQYAALVEKYFSLSHYLPVEVNIQMGELIFAKIYRFSDYSVFKIQLFKHLLNFRHVSPADKIFEAESGVIEYIIKESIESKSKESIHVMLRFVNEIYEAPSTRYLLDSKIIIEISNRLIREIQHPIKGDLRILVEYLKLLSNFRDNIFFREHLESIRFRELFDFVLSEISHEEGLFLQVESLKVMQKLLSSFPEIKESISLNNIENISREIERGIEYSIKENSYFGVQYLIEYLRFLKSLGIRNIYDGYLLQDIIAECIYLTWSSIGRGKNLLRQVDIVTLMQELSGFFEIKEFISPTVFEKLIRIIDRDVEYLVRENPYFGIEYLKVLKNFGNTRLHEKYLRQSIIEELFDVTFKSSNGKNFSLQIDFLRLVQELVTTKNLEELINPHMIEEIFHRISKHNIGDDPLLRIEYLRLLIGLGNHKLISNFFPRIIELDEQIPYEFFNHFELLIKIIYDERRN